MRDTQSTTAAAARGGANAAADDSWRGLTAEEGDDRLAPPHTTTVWESTVELVTGRTHQIRAQSAAAGVPLVGDVLYGGVDLSGGSGGGGTGGKGRDLEDGGGSGDEGVDGGKWEDGASDEIAGGGVSEARTAAVAHLLGSGSRCNGGGDGRGAGSAGGDQVEASCTADAVGEGGGSAWTSNTSAASHWTADAKSAPLSHSAGTGGRHAAVWAACSVPRVLGNADRLGLHAAELTMEISGPMGSPGTVFRAGRPWWRQ